MFRGVGGLFLSALQPEKPFFLLKEVGGFVNLETKFMYMYLEVISSDYINRVVEYDALYDTLYDMGIYCMF